MDKAVMGFLGGASALAMLGAQPAAAALPNDGALQLARSYAELLDPIPNASSLLRAEDERAAQQSSQEPMELAQVYFGFGPPGYYYHHHHHHHHYYYHHHHHHHHHWRYGYPRHHYHHYYGYY